MYKALNKIIGLLFCCTILIIIVDIQSGSAQDQYFPQVVINASGAVEPTNAPIQTNGQNYILTGDVGSITIKKSYIVLDGGGHMMPGKVSFIDSLGNNVTANNAGGVFLTNVNNVTVKNIVIKETQTGIWLDHSTGCVITNNTIIGTIALPYQPTAGIYVWAGSQNTIAGNQLSNNYNGIYIAYQSNQNMVTQNNITGSDLGIVIENANYDGTEKNSFYDNNISNNAVDVYTHTEGINFWDKGKVGNYWSSYNGSDLNRDGIGDTPHIIDSNNQDNYPLMAPYGSNTTMPQDELIPTTIAIAASITIAIIVLVVALIVYMNRRK
jgi:parallel beta-helix repeat protein